MRLLIKKFFRQRQIQGSEQVDVNPQISVQFAIFERHHRAVLSSRREANTQGGRSTNHIFRPRDWPSWVRFAAAVYCGVRVNR